MPVASVGDQRWTQVGTNGAGNRVFARDRKAYDASTKEELASELERRGLAKSGTKGEMIERLNEADAQ